MIQYEVRQKSPTRKGEDAKGFTKDPYILVFDAVITQLFRQMSLLPEQEKLTMFFHTSSFEPKAQKVYARRKMNDRNGDRLASNPFFVSDVKSLPIQAADILANLMRNYVRGEVGHDLPMQRIHKYLVLLMRANPTSVKVLEARDLTNTEKRLSRLLNS